MNRYFKVGELANLTGITVRTLHYYDDIGLLKPVTVTNSNHRLYDSTSLLDLYRIITMKDMGFRLEEIITLFQSNDLNLNELIDLQISRVQDEITHKQVLLSKLFKIKHHLKQDDDLPFDDFQEMMQFINSSADQHFTPDQIQRLKNSQKSFVSEADMNSDWFDFINRLEKCYKLNLPKTDLTAKECAEFWKRMNSNLIGNDVQMKESVLSFHSSPESKSMKFGLTKELFQYLMSITQA